MTENQFTSVMEQIRTLAIPSKEIMTVEDCALYTGLSTSYIYKLTHRKEIPFFKPMGKRLYFKRSEIEQWLLRNRQGDVSWYKWTVSLRRERRSVERFFVLTMNPNAWSKRLSGSVSPLSVGQPGGGWRDRGKFHGVKESGEAPYGCCRICWPGCRSNLLSGLPRYGTLYFRLGLKVSLANWWVRWLVNDLENHKNNPQVIDFAKY